MAMSREIIKSIGELVFGGGRDRVQCGQNSEFADMCNPHGYLYKNAFYIEAQNKEGYRWYFHESYDTVDEAKAMTSRLESGEVAIDENHWRYGDPVYGSRAYQYEGCEMEQIERERRGE